MIKLGGKTHDTRILVGGEVRSKSPGKELFVIALDYSAQYPAQIEANNVSTSTRVDKRIIQNPELYGLKIIKEKTIRDCYNTRKIFWMKSLNENDNKIYRVEEFKCEFKLDKDAIEENLDTVISSRKVDKEYLNAIDNIRKLYPEVEYNEQKHQLYLPNSTIKLTHSNLPATVIKSVYFVQSSKAENGWTDEHLSLNEIMLTDLRFKRNEMKKKMAEAEKNEDEFNTIRYNSKQLAIKIVCNSTYGASGSSFYAYYDPDIGATITWCAREMIHDLTYVLESEKIFVDEQFIKDNLVQYNKLLKYGIVKQVDFNKEIDDYKDIIALSLRRLYDKEWNPVGKFIKLELHPAKIIYQDTDSNYYVIRYLQELFKNRHSPHDINKVMHVMKKHNEFFQSFMSLSIFRPPIGLGFEAAKIIARYFNVKKRYYGIEWNPNMKDKLNEDAYVNGVLKKNYNKYWVPGKTTLPLEDGSYLKVDKELLEKDIDFVNYMHHNNLSVTGMPLTRRDSFRFTNYLNLLVYKEDLSLTKYIGNNQWEDNLNNNLEDVVIGVLNIFKKQINDIEILVNNGINNINTKYELPEPFFHLKDYSQQVQYKPETKNNNIMNKIIERYKSTGRKEIEVFQRINYVAINTPEIKKLISEGKSSIGNISEFAFTIDELLDEYHEKLPKEKYESLYVSDYISYNDFIELYIISNLCYRYYFKALCSTLSSFAVEYLNGDEIKKIRENIMDKEEQKKQIKHLTDKSGEYLLQLYFPYGARLRKSLSINKPKKMIKNITSKTQMKIHEYITELYPDYAHKTDINQFKTALYNDRDVTSILINDINKVITVYSFNKVNIPVLKNDRQMKIYKKIVKENKLDYYVDRVNKLNDRLNKIELILCKID